MSLWDSRQFAMQLVASGQPVNLAIANVIAFEREWSVAHARLSAEENVMSERLRSLRDITGPWSRADRVKWMRETQRLAREAGDAAQQDALDAREKP